MVKRGRLVRTSFLGRRPSRVAAILSDLPADRYAIDSPERDKMLILLLSPLVLHWWH
jgi:hypothetical protein